MVNQAIMDVDEYNELKKLQRDFDKDLDEWIKKYSKWVRFGLPAVCAFFGFFVGFLVSELIRSLS